MAKTFELLLDIGLIGRREAGNDLFFGGADTSDRIWSQRMVELTYELRLPVGGERTIAVGSFNFHNDLFGRDFTVEHSDGGSAFSGCSDSVWNARSTPSSASSGWTSGNGRPSFATRRRRRNRPAGSPWAGGRPVGCPRPIQCTIGPV
jgi:hypothetical protein